MHQQESSTNSKKVDLQCKSDMHHHSIVHNLWIALVLNGLFTVIEFVGGWWTGSIAILSDALHDLGDTLIIIFAIIMEKWSIRPAGIKYRYGYSRLSPLGGFTTSLVLLLGSGIIIYMAIQRFFNPVEVMASGMLFLAVLGIVFNGLAVYKLKGSDSINQKAVQLHLMEDVLGWVAIFVGSIVIWIWNWNFIDPILSILIGCYIMYNATKNGWTAMQIFLQSVPPKVDLEEVEKQILQIENLDKLQEFKAWSLDGNKHVASLKVITNNHNNTLSHASMKSNIRSLLEKYKFVDITIEFNPRDPD